MRRIRYYLADNGSRHSLAYVLERVRWRLAFAVPRPVRRWIVGAALLDYSRRHPHAEVPAVPAMALFADGA